MTPSPATGRDAAEQLVRRYYDTFNRGDRAAFLALLADEVVHDISQGDRQTGRDTFAAFMAHMDRFYREQVSELVVMTEATGTQAAARFIVQGSYIATDPGVPATTPPAHGQHYRLPAGAFFTLRDGRVTGIANHYNLADWVRQIGG